LAHSRFPVLGSDGRHHLVALDRRRARIVLDEQRLDLVLVYLPHLDYDLQRYGPTAPQATAAAAEIDEVAGRPAEDARGRSDP
jgi:predicted AlkP superfamily pyrophosphatase or phosphodiesterase